MSSTRVVMASAVFPAYLSDARASHAHMVVRDRGALRRRPVDGAHGGPDERGRRLSGLPVGDPRIQRTLVAPISAAGSPRRRRPAASRSGRGRSSRRSRWSCPSRSSSTRSGRLRCRGEGSAQRLVGGRPALRRHRVPLGVVRRRRRRRSVVALAGVRRVRGVLHDRRGADRSCPPASGGRRSSTSQSSGSARGFVPLVLGLGLDARAADGGPEPRAGDSRRCRCSRSSRSRSRRRRSTSASAARTSSATGTCSTSCPFSWWLGGGARVRRRRRPPSAWRAVTVVFAAAALGLAYPTFPGISRRQSGEHPQRDPDRPVRLARRSGRSSRSRSSSSALTLVRRPRSSSRAPRWHSSSSRPSSRSRRRCSGVRPTGSSTGRA